jgi:hypothetical protein
MVESLGRRPHHGRSKGTSTTGEEKQNQGNDLPTSRKGPRIPSYSSISRGVAQKGRRSTGGLWGPMGMGNGRGSGGKRRPQIGDLGRVDQASTAGRCRLLPSEGGLCRSPHLERPSKTVTKAIENLPTCCRTATKPPGTHDSRSVVSLHALAEQPEGGPGERPTGDRSGIMAKTSSKLKPRSTTIRGASHPMYR